MLALIWIAVLTSILVVCFKYYNLKHLWLTFCIASALYFGFMFSVVLFIPKDMEVTDSVRLSSVYTNTTDRFLNIRGLSRTYSGNADADDAINAKLKSVVMSYAHSKSDIAMHLNDEVNTHVTNKNAYWLKYILCGGADSIYTADVSIKDISKSCKFSGVITEEVFSSEPVNKIGDLYFCINGGRISKEYVNKPVEVEIAYSDLFSKNNVIYSYDVISAKEVK